MPSNNIYTIYKFTNTINKKVYIGMTSDFNRRINSHKHAYKKEDTALYRSIRKHGWEHFLIEIIYQTKIYQHCLDMECYFIIEYNSYDKGYNMTFGGEGSLGANAKQYEFYDIYGNYFNVTNLHKFCYENNLNSKCMYQLANNKVLKYDIYVSTKPSTRKYKTYNVYDTIKNKIIEIENLPDFCDKNSLDKNKMYSLVANMRNVYKNYKNINKLDYITPEEKEYNFILDGKVIKIYNLKKYCLDNNLNFSRMVDVWRGKGKWYNGYKNINYPDYIPLQNRKLKLINEFNEIIIINNMKKFCRENDLNYDCIIAVKQKRQNAHKGYRLYE